MVGPQQTPGSNHRISNPQHRHRATGLESLVAWPVVSLLRPPKCSRNSLAPDIGAWGGTAPCTGADLPMPLWCWHGLPGLLTCLSHKETPGATWAVSPERPSGPGGRALSLEAHDPKSSPRPATSAYKLGKSPSCAKPHFSFLSDGVTPWGGMTELVDESLQCVVPNRFLVSTCGRCG